VSPDPGSLFQFAGITGCGKPVVERVRVAAKQAETSGCKNAQSVSRTIGHGQNAGYQRSPVASPARRICRPAKILLKKETGRYAARRAEVGVRTRKSNQGRWFVGYKKHSLRLWLANVADQVVLAPLMSWAAPANRQDLLFLEPSLRYCHKRLDFVPDLVVADMAYIHMEMQRRVRDQLGVGIVTRLRPDFDLPKRLEPSVLFQCSQGQSLEWLGLHPADQLHWFAVRSHEPLCPWCWQQNSCPREFSFAPTDHEIALGTIPVNSTTARRLLKQVRSWIEASQSYEKNQLGLGKMYLNSLRLCWFVSLLADTVCLLRAHAILQAPPARTPLKKMLPGQMNFQF
jgi:hypothetical protein